MESHNAHIVAHRCRARASDRISKPCPLRRVAWSGSRFAILAALDELPTWPGVFFFGGLFGSQNPNRGAHRWPSYHPVRFAGVRLSSRCNMEWVLQCTDWNTPANWNPGSRSRPEPPFSVVGCCKTTFRSWAAVHVGTLQFNAPNYTFDVSTCDLTINGTGIKASLANSADVQCHRYRNNSTPPMVFNGSSSAGTAKIVAGEVTDTNGGFDGGFIKFFGSLARLVKRRSQRETLRTLNFTIRAPLAMRRSLPPAAGSFFSTTPPR